MQNYDDEVNSIGYEYRPISQNSNSFAGGALQRAGFYGPGTEFPERFDSQLGFDPVSGETRSFNVPGFEKPLANPINTGTPTFDDRFGKWASSPTPDRPVSFEKRLGNWRASPAGSTPLATPAESFDDRFGIWGFAPAGGFGDTRSPVLRALQNYKRSAAPDGPVSTAAQGAPRAAPNLPIDKSAFGDRPETAPGVPRPDVNSRRVSYGVSSAFPDITSRNPDGATPRPERAPLLGIFSGKPMSL